MSEPITTSYGESVSTLEAQMITKINELIQECNELRSIIDMTGDDEDTCPTCHGTGRILANTQEPDSHENCECGCHGDEIEDVEIKRGKNCVYCCHNHAISPNQEPAGDELDEMLFFQSQPGSGNMLADWQIAQVKAALRAWRDTAIIQELENILAYRNGDNRRRTKRVTDRIAQLKGDSK